MPGSKASSALGQQGTRTAAARWPPPFRREETEAFVSHVRSHQSEASGDRMLEWCSSREYCSQNILYRKTCTLSKKAIDAYIPEGIQRADFTEILDGNQRLIFFFRCLYDAIKELFFLWTVVCIDLYWYVCIMAWYVEACICMYWFVLM